MRRSPFRSLLQGMRSCVVNDFVIRVVVGVFIRVPSKDGVRVIGDLGRSDFFGVVCLICGVS